MKEKIKPIFSKPAAATVYIAVTSVFAAWAQTPTHYPTGKNPQPFTFWNVLFYIVIPVILVVAWIWIRRSKAKSNGDDGSREGGSKEDDSDEEGNREDSNK